MSALWTAKAAKAKKAAKSASKKKNQQAHTPRSKRARSEERSDSESRHSRKRSRNNTPNHLREHHANAYHATFLTEEENLACYYPLPQQPKQPPSPAFLRKLHDELLAYSSSHVPTAAMTKARWSIIHSVRDAARDMWGPEVDVLPFGSFVTGLYIGSSDIDLVILDVQYQRSQVPQLLTKLGNRLRKQGLARDVTIIPSARVPLLKYIDVSSGVPVDISLGIVEGVESANLMRKQIDTYPALKPLALFLKAFMQKLGLADVFKGGVSSYILQVMILFHLQTQDALHPQPVPAVPLVFSTATTAPLSPTSNLGFLLLTFFELFGFTFSYEEHGIRIHDLKKTSTSKLECYTKSQQGRLNREKSYLLSIEDPIQKERDIGANCFGIRRIQRCFAVAREFLCSEPQQAGGAASRPATPTHTQPAFVIDTVGDSAGASSSAAASTSPAIDPHGTEFSSSFGFILSTLLDLPVKYSISDLKRAAQKQPAWNTIVAKMERLAVIKGKKDAKTARKEAKEEKERKKAAAAPGTADSIDLTSAYGAGHSSAHETDGDDNDSDVELLEHGSAHQPIPIDDLTSGDDEASESEDEDEPDEPPAKRRAASRSKSPRRSKSAPSTPCGPRASPTSESSGTPSPALLAPLDGALDGDAMLDEAPDEAMELNFA